MADCDGFTLSMPVLTCASDIETWAVSLVNVLQSAIDHVIACVQDFAYPQCDICVLKDDLVDCPLTCDMIDFSGIVYAAEGGVCQLPQPSSGLDFRYGTGIVTPQFGGVGTWRSVYVTFDTPFPVECLWMGVTVETDLNCITLPNGGPPSGLGINGTNCIVVQGYSAAGCTVWIYKASTSHECNVQFRYMAAGR